MLNSAPHHQQAEREEEVHITEEILLEILEATDKVNSRLGWILVILTIMLLAPILLTIIYWASVAVILSRVSIFPG
jgi:hypothetical protein